MAAASEGALAAATAAQTRTRYPALAQTAQPTSHRVPPLLSTARLRNSKWWPRRLGSPPSTPRSSRGNSQRRRKLRLADGCRTTATHLSQLTSRGPTPQVEAAEWAELGKEVGAHPSSLRRGPPTRPGHTAPIRRTGRRAGARADGDAAADRRCGVARGGAGCVGGVGTHRATVRRCGARTKLQRRRRGGAHLRSQDDTLLPARCRYESGLFERLVPLALCRRLERGLRPPPQVDGCTAGHLVGGGAGGGTAGALRRVGGLVGRGDALAALGGAPPRSPGRYVPAPHGASTRVPHLTGAPLPLGGGGRCRVPRRAQGAG